MTIHDPDRLAELEPLVRAALRKVPQWQVFETDAPREDRSALTWLSTGTSSPLRGETGGRRPLIEWEAIDGGWTADINAPPVAGSHGRVARIRYRARRPH